jgi:CxxC motif-containing protein (DUF1111 family)
MRRTIPLLALAACGGTSAEPDPDWLHYAVTPGDPISGLSSDDLALFERGREVLDHAFSAGEGLGPTFNAVACASCHQAPMSGGSAPRYRDFFLVKRPRWDGAMVDAGSNGVSPVRNLYALHGGTKAEPADVAVYARRNAPSGLGIGLFEFIPDDVILAREDPDDRDGDGISGRANYEQNRVGRFGYKSQASSMESFNRGAMLNQMGITSNPLFFEFEDSRRLDTASWLDLLYASAYAQVSAPGEPTTDDDGAPDPEMSNADQTALLVFSTFLAPPRPQPRTALTRKGAKAFEAAGCDGCHVPRLDSTIGPLPLYSDLLLHDLGEENADGIAPGLATKTEFRSQPLWGVALHAPYLHDGSAETLEDAILAHGGEGAASRDGFRALPDDDRAALLAFLESLGPPIPSNQLFDTELHPRPSVGEPGGPVEVLSSDEQAVFDEGRALFDRTFAVDQGLGESFNADSCRACHRDPVLGGSGPADTSVIRFGRVDEGGYRQLLGMNALPRQVVPGLRPVRLPDEANVVELRQPPTALGVGLIDGIDAAAILAGEDPEDLDGDGISGRARVLGDGAVGRFGWKAQIPTIEDFVADAMLNELGVTLDPSYSPFTRADADAHPDPELDVADADAMAFWLRMLAPPPRKGDDASGEALFQSVGCAACHVPVLDGVPLYSDLLLHEIAAPDAVLVDQEPGLSPREFRTPPLWGVSDTAPFLHDGVAFTLRDAIAGHHGEGVAARDAFAALSESDQEALVRFLESL